MRQMLIFAANFIVGLGVGCLLYWAVHPGGLRLTLRRRREPIEPLNPIEPLEEVVKPRDISVHQGPAAIPLKREWVEQAKHIDPFADQRSCCQRATTLHAVQTPNGTTSLVRLCYDHANIAHALQDAYYTGRARAFDEGRDTVRRISERVDRLHQRIDEQHTP